MDIDIHSKRNEELDAIGELLTLANSESWEVRLSSTVTVDKLLLSLPSENTVERLIEICSGLAKDKKWEVRKAVVPILVKIRRPAATAIIEQLTTDANKWVRSAAKQAKSRIGRVTTPGDKLNRRADFTFEKIKDFDSASGKKIYDTAVRVGERAYEELAGDTAHELNTYRTTMDGLLGELESRLGQVAPSDTGIQKIFDKIKERSKFLKSLTNGLVEYARDIEVSFQEKQLHPIVKDALELARGKNEASLEHKEISEVISIPQGLKFEADWDRLFLAFVNLFSNAIEASLDCAEESSIGFQANTDRDNCIVLTVTDEGCGMDPSQTENAKRPFCSLKRDRGGIGLGLPLAVKIIEKEHKGQLDIESELGVGTRIIIELPLKQKETN